MAGTFRQRGLVRQWKLVQALQGSRRGMTFAQLRDAANEPVSERTIRRDIDTLTFAGLPVDVESGVAGPAAMPAKVFWREESVH